MEERTPKRRLYFLDWLRVIAFGLLVFYHTGLMFVDWGFHIQNSSFSETLKLPMLFLNQWRLPLLFFVSGAGICFALGTRTAGIFAQERFKRIFLPLVFGIVVIIPPQVYFEWLHHQTFKGSYWQFYPLFFSNITWNHLWFLAYLFVFTFIALPFFLYLRSKAGTSIVAPISTCLSKRFYLLSLFVIPLFLTELFLRPHWPDTRNLVSDWYNFLFYFLIFIYGFFFATAGSFWDMLEHRRSMYLLLGLFSFSMIYFGWHQPGKNFLETFVVGRYIFDFLKCVNILSWIFCSLGYARHYLAHNSARLQYANRAVYPFYILHQTVLIAIGFYVIRCEWSITAKYIIIVTGTFFFTMLLYEFLIRRVKLIGVFFGVK
ncbi:acyltransferase family protein [Chryseolinea sp. H1M3-3]|uniref:acyltransferase family protein n=1 Tax=Chryseolinea sp. H1M3-3 TaxID=3034144 RepID=UPI0023EAB0E6|nr:acyltransferase family protein [Chryseolinea sp. H1M3-3]